MRLILPLAKRLHRPVDKRPQFAAEVAVGRVDHVHLLRRRLPVVQQADQLTAVEVRLRHKAIGLDDAQSGGLAASRALPSLMLTG